MRGFGLVVAGVLAGAALVGGGVALADGLPWRGDAEIGYVKERRLIPAGYLSTNVVCPEGRQAVGGGYAHLGEHDRESPVIAEVSAPSNTSGDPGKVNNAWSLFFMNDKEDPTPVDVYVICAPIGG
ncbi:hypothetical protein FXF51_24160 [Nonomuraea sp. PA05]|uniref:hypothetical protein n=1 Tax=Nonomuraea sp. PA05 TaxID=2604466 RepID=UPI0011D7F1C3|nr:hypothetical protein [Nonomuraea sp. PA05]TYB63282.1 hypothetical protein FXF51_24160 [Nonomuraea sp. PA05]